ncbi:Ig-like domain-containing protein [Corallococcus sp. BB11-1]|uniref:Ig-like domain-containing protein n=1 Tax=Corallococcus sp. BB11-1 TaxID=2996783 RepID=UPI0022717CA3|nr:Ig-like domain-containing protein [Corallococcus sp. BB11-1]MCY1031445.1 Ig-like domain-containing protein [Corallococcus sp. BB11-1]
MPRLKLLMLLSCIGLSPACIEIPPLEAPVDDVQPDPNADFTLSVSTSQEQVLPGGTLGCEVQLAWAGVKGGDVTLSLLNPPKGVEFQPTTLRAEETRKALSIRIGADTPPGPHTVTLQGRSGAVTKEATLAMTVGKAGDLMVNWVVPTPGKAYTNGPLLLQFTVEGGSAEAVEILKDASVLAKPTGTPFAYTWDTTQEAEGSYQLSVRAIRGGATFISAPRTVVVDRTAPTVSSFLPARNAAAVGVHESIQVTFSEPMNPRTLTDASVQVTASDSAPIDKSVNLSADGRTLTVTPINPLVAPNTLHVEFTNLVGLVITDLAGNEVVDMPAWSFSVPTWLPLGGAISAVPGNTSAEGVVLKMDRNDRPVVAWAESDGATKNIYVARWTGSNWSILGGALSGMGTVGTNATRPTLLIDNANQPIVGWQEEAGPGLDDSIFVRRWTERGWEALPSISLFPGDFAISTPSLAFESNATLHLYALNSGDAIAQIGHYQLTTGNSAWTRTSLPRPSESPRVYSLSTTFSGSKAFIAYSVLDLSGTGDGRRGVAVSENDAPPLGDGVLGETAWSPSVSLDSNSRPWITWAESASSPESDGLIYWARWEGTAWTTPVAISSTSTGNHEPALGMSTGAPHVLAWSGIINAERSIFVSRWIGNQWHGFDRPIDALADTGTPAFSPSIAMDADGQPLLAWVEQSALSASIYVSRLNH